MFDPHRSRPLAILPLTLLLPLAAVAESQSPPDVLETITVIAERKEGELSRVPASVTVIGEEELRRQQAESLADVLARVPSVEPNGGPRTTAMQPSIRGLGGERIVIRTDGVRQNFSSGHRGRFFSDTGQLGGVEVLRGSASALYGSGALGGVLAFRSLEVDDLLSAEQPSGARLMAGYGSNNDARYGTLVAAQRFGDRFDVLGGVTRRKTDDLEDGDGETIPFSADDVSNLTAKLGWRPSAEHRFQLNFQRYRNEHEIPSSANTASITNIVDRDTRQDMVSLQYAYQHAERDWLNLDATAYYNNVDLTERLIDGDRIDDTELTTLGVELSQAHRIELSEQLALNLTLGGELYRDRQEGRRNGALREQFPKAEQRVTGIYSRAELNWNERVALIPALRYDSVRQTNPDLPNRSESELSPQVTLALYPSERWMLYGTWAEAFRAPSLTELYVRGQHFPGNNFVPNPDLRPETAENKEFGVGYSHRGLISGDDGLRLRFAAFRNDYDDFIQSRVSMFPPPGTTSRDNVEKARIEGLEFEAQYEAPRWFAALAASRLRGDDRNDDEPLSGIPADKVALSLGYRFPALNMDAGWQGFWVASQRRLREGDPGASGYAVHSLFAAWAPAHGPLAGARVDLRIENLFDETYRNVLDALNSPGRTARLSLSYDFGT